MWTWAMRLTAPRSAAVADAPGSVCCLTAQTGLRGEERGAAAGSSGPSLRCAALRCAALRCVG